MLQTDRRYRDLASKQGVPDTKSAERKKGGLQIQNNVNEVEKQKWYVLSAPLVIKYGQDMVKPKVVTDYNSQMGGEGLSDTYLTCFRSTSKKLKKYYQKHIHHLNDICC